MTHFSGDKSIMIITHIENYMDDQQAIIFDINSIKDEIYKVDIAVNPQVDNVLIYGGIGTVIKDDEIDAKY